MWSITAVRFITIFEREEKEMMDILEIADSGPGPAYFGRSSSGFPWQAQSHATVPSSKSPAFNVVIPGQRW